MMRVANVTRVVRRLKMAWVVRVASEVCHGGEGDKEDCQLQPE